jgi:uncharacterized repeat protein (TIGR03803 family)
MPSCGGSNSSGGGSGGGGNCSLGLNPGFCGTLTGLPGGGSVTLTFSTSDAGGGNLIVSANGPFAYMLSTQVDVSTTWNISVATETPGTSCNVTNQGSDGSGGVRVQEITGVAVSCSTATDYTIGGTLSGLNSGTQITLENNGSDSLTLSANGAFTFHTPVNKGGSYSVTVSAQPTDELCTVSQGVGSNVTANITSVAVTCSAAFPIGGTLTGLSSGALITLEDNGGDSLGLSSNGAFTFPTPILEGDAYSVTVAIQPANQFCSVTGGMGTVSGVVNGVQVACVIVEQILYSFTGNSGDGASPHASMVKDTAGNFYGTTAHGGTNNFGTVFKLTPNGSGGYVESIVYAFASGSDGDTPQAGLIIDSSGNLFGTTLGGGSDNFGTVFKLAPNGSGGFVESVLYSFTDINGGPEAPLIIDNAGNLYGTTVGFQGSGPSNGLVFRLAPNGSGGYTESVLYAFTGGSDGGNSRAGLIRDSAGNLYGTTSGGGNNSNNCNNGCGVVFKLAPNGSGGYTESVLYSFTGGNDGWSPEAGLITDSAGNFYGTTAVGGPSNGGTVFKLAPNGSGGYTESVLYSFVFESADGLDPAAGLLMDSAGNLYGTTLDGGLGYGTVFKLAPNGSGGYVESILHAFSPGSDGASPQAGLITDSTGKLYGTTTAGGNQSCTNGCGTVFEMTQ